MQEGKLRTKHADTYHILQGRLSCFGSLKRFTREKKKIMEDNQQLPKQQKYRKVKANNLAEM